MKLLTRLYLMLCLLGLGAFAWAEYQGLVLTGDDESARSTHHNPSARIYHK